MLLPVCLLLASHVSGGSHDCGGRDGSDDGESDGDDGVGYDSGYGGGGDRDGDSGDDCGGDDDGYDDSNGGDVMMAMGMVAMVVKMLMMVTE